MRFKKYLAEEYLTMIKFHNGNSYEIFKNPDRSEIMDILKEQRKDPLNEPNEFRFLVDKNTGDWYAFSYRVNHKEAAILGLQKIKVHEDFYSAVGKLNGARGLRWSHFWHLSDKDIEKCNEFLKAKGWKAEYVKGDKFFNEEYVLSWRADRHYSTKWSGGDTTIFVNPSKKEMKEASQNSIGNTVRFFADFDTEKLYIWRGETVHYMARNKLSREEEINLENYIKGVAVYSNGKLHIPDRKNFYWDAPGLTVDDYDHYDNIDEWEEVREKFNDGWLKTWFAEDSVIDVLFDRIMDSIHDDLGTERIETS